MSPDEALKFFRHWTMEVMPAKHIDTFNQAFLVLSQLVAAAAKPKVDAKAE